MSYLDKTRLVEEVPGLPREERYYIWHQRKVAWKGPTAVAGKQWAASQGITIDEEESFEP